MGGNWLRKWLPSRRREIPFDPPHQRPRTAACRPRSGPHPAPERNWDDWSGVARDRSQTRTSHEIAVALLDDIANVNPDAGLNPRVLRHARVAFNQAGLHFDRPARRIDHAAELNDRAVTGALDDAAVMGGYGRVDEIGAQARRRARVLSSSVPASRE
jgi:hypothetical protein